MLFESLILVLTLAALALLWLLLRQSQRRDSEFAAWRAELPVRLEAERLRLFDQFQAWLDLRDRLGLRRGLPYNPQWSAGTDFLQRIVQHTLSAQPRHIVECGSGLSSLMLARCCEMNGAGRLFSLENGEEHADRSRAEIERYGLGGWARILHAPLREWRLGDETYRWYGLDALPNTPIDLLVIDGPPGFIQRHSRYPALPLLRDRLADGCVIFLDDAARPDEKAVVARWLAECPGLSHEYHAGERGCSILRYRAETSGS